MTQSSNMTQTFSLGKNLYECKCIQCKIELDELKEQFPEGTPIPIKCDKCKEETDYKLKLKIFNDRFQSFLKEVPECYKEHIKFKLDLDTFDKYKNWFSNKDKWGVIYYGTTGTGKTTKALISLAKAEVFLGIKGELIEAPRLAKRLRSDAMNGKNPEEQFNYFSRLSVLIIDDFLTEQDDHRDKGLIESLIAEREKHFRKTYLTTNATPEQLTEETNGYSLRMQSRMQKMIRMAVKGKDLRSQ